MRNYCLLTYANDRMVSYEPIVARTDSEAVSFIHGMLSERARNHTNFLAKVGVRYVVDHGERSLEELATSPQTMMGAWHLVEFDGQSRLVWEPNEKS